MTKLETLNTLPRSATELASSLSTTHQQMLELQQEMANNLSQFSGSLQALESMRSQMLEQLQQSSQTTASMSTLDSNRVSLTKSLKSLSTETKSLQSTHLKLAGVLDRRADWAQVIVACLLTSLLTSAAMVGLFLKLMK